MSKTERWDPARERFRVRWVFRSNSPGLFGWDDEVRTYASLTDAMAAAETRVRRSNFIDVRIDFACNAQTWGTNGHWKRVGVRKRGERNVCLEWNVCLNDGNS